MVMMKRTMQGLKPAQSYQQSPMTVEYAPANRTFVGNNGPITAPGTGGLANPTITAPTSSGSGVSGLPGLTKSPTSSTSPIIGGLAGAAVGAMLNNVLNKNTNTKTNPATGVIPQVINSVLKPGGSKSTIPTGGGSTVNIPGGSKTTPTKTTGGGGGGGGGGTSGTTANTDPAAADQAAGITRYDDGSYTQVFDDGSSVTYNSDGSVFSVTDSEGATTYPGGNQTDTTAGQTDLGGGYYQDANGAIYDANGDLVYDPSTDNALGTGDGTTYYDAFGNAYDASGNLIQDNSANYDTSNTDNTDNTTFDETPPTEVVDVPVDENQDYANGGLATPLFARGGGIHMADGGDVTVIDSVDNGDGTYTQYYSDGTEETFDNPTSNVQYNPDGTTTSVPIDNSNPSLIDTITGGLRNAGNTISRIVNPRVSGGGGGNQDNTGFLNSLQNNLGAIGGGALVGSLLQQILNSSGGSSGSVNQGVDMSKVGVINPRTTAFGVGPARTVSASEYQQPSTVKLGNVGDLYGNLGITGFDQTPQQQMADGGQPMTHFTFGTPSDPERNLGLKMRQGGLSAASEPLHVPTVDGRHDYRQGAAVKGEGDGQSDDIPAMLADGEYVLDAEIVSALGNGSNKAGAEVLDKWREQIRKHKRSGPLDKIPPKAKSPLAYMKGVK